ncbi:hypothetical protein KL912_001851 [Ogataea haglerorum]|nr:hypothetical protein KL912_001851 [Ogataea haglerorum]
MASNSSCADSAVRRSQSVRGEQALSSGHRTAVRWSHSPFRSTWVSWVSPFRSQGLRVRGGPIEAVGDGPGLPFSAPVRVPKHRPSSANSLARHNLSQKRRRQVLAVDPGARHLEGGEGRDQKALFRLAGGVERPAHYPERPRRRARLQTRLPWRMEHRVRGDRRSAGHGHRKHRQSAQHAAHHQPGPQGSCLGADRQSPRSAAEQSVGGGSAPGAPVPRVLQPLDRRREFRRSKHGGRVSVSQEPAAGRGGRIRVPAPGQSCGGVLRGVVAAFAETAAAPRELSAAAAREIY